VIVQDIVNAVSIDTRQVLQASGNDANVIMSWVDRVHKDVLHSTLFTNQNMATTSTTTSVLTSSYTLNPTTPIRRIISIYDTTFNMSLTPADVDLDSPTPVMTRVNEEQGHSSAQINNPHPSQAYRFGGTPEYFRFIAPATLLIRPAPASAGYVSTLNIVYEQLVQTLSTLSAPLIVPDDGKDIMVAGCNWMAMAYIGRPQEAMSWFQLYQQLKQGNRTGVLR
jgi:hypothetical protein